MISLRKHFLTAAAGIALAVAFSTGASATLITLDPSANNAPAGPALDATTTAFTANSAVVSSIALIDLHSLGGGFFSFQETANFNVTTFDTGNHNVNVAGHYQLFGSVTTSGILQQVAAGTFIGTTINSFNVTMFGASGATAVFNRPTSLADSGITNNTGFVLGTGTHIASATDFAELVLVGAHALTSPFQGVSDFTPSVGTTPTGIFQGPIPFNIDLFANVNGPANPIVDTDVFACDAGTGVANVAGTDTCVGLGDHTGPGSGTISFAAVPEPGTIAILGASLFGLGAVVRRRRQV